MFGKLFPYLSVTSSRHIDRVRGRVPLLLSLTCYFGLGTAYLFPASAQVINPSVPQPSLAPLDMSLLKANSPIRNNVITINNISQKSLTIPSFWWAKEQFAPSKLLNNWLAYPKQGRVDLVVNRQLWTLLDYMGRYRFINNFGTVARDYGYNVRVFFANQPDTPLASYTCDYSKASPLCNIQLQSSSSDRLRSQNEQSR